MSSERPQSPVWDDVMRVWTDPRGVAEAGLRDGRGWADWWRVLAIYALAYTFSYVMDGRTGADKLWGALVDDDSNSSTSSYPEYIYFSLIGWFLAGVFLFQWLVLPRVSGWFGGSQYRRDASTAYYFFFCVAFLPSFITPLTGLLGVVVQKYAAPMGSFLMLASLVLVLLFMLHQSTRVMQRSMFIDNYIKALLVQLVSLMIGISAGFIMLSMVAIPLYTFFPHTPDTLP